MNDSAIFGMLGLLIGGAGVWAVMRARLAETRLDLEHYERQADAYYDAYDAAETELDSERFAAANERCLRAEAEAAHSRLSDAHNTQSARIERALDQVTEGANATVVRMARILKGDL